jgi:hypothetical protein
VAAETLDLTQNHYTIERTVENTLLLNTLKTCKGRAVLLVASTIQKTGAHRDQRNPSFSHHVLRKPSGSSMKDLPQLRKS